MIIITYPTLTLVVTFYISDNHVYIKDYKPISPDVY